MKSRLIALPVLFLSLTGVASYGAADPQLLGLMMPDAKVLAGLSVADSQSTPFGQFLLKQIPANAGLDNFVAATGFDPRQDLNEVVGASAGGNSWLVAGRGSFAATRIAGLAEMAGASVTRYRGSDLITGNPNGRNQNRANGNPPKGNSPNGAGAAGGAPVNGVAFLDSSTVLFGDVSLIKAAIDRHATGVVFNGPLATKAQNVSSGNQAWAASLSSPSDLVQGLSSVQAPNNPMENVLQGITGLSLGVQLGAANVTVSGEAATRSDKDAQALSDVLHFLMAMAQGSRNNPQGGSAAALADAALISTQGASVRLTLTVPEQQLEQMFPSQAGVRKISRQVR